MSNKQARATKKLVLKAIIAVFEDGTKTALDINKVDVVNRLTKESIFKEK